MSTPMSAASYLKQLNEWNVGHRQYSSTWSRHNRSVTGNPWGPVNGVMLHHTGSNSHNIKMLWDGHTSLPGPLCHVGIDKTGLVWLTGWGRTNHAGLGDNTVLSHVIYEDYTGVLRPESNIVDGNSRFYGAEIEYSGSNGMSAAQYKSAITWAASICDYHGWSAKSVIGHGEWQVGKWDPGYSSGKMMDMNAVRNDIQEMLDRKSAPKPAPKPKPPAPRIFTVRAGDKIKIGNSILTVTEVK